MRTRSVFLWLLATVAATAIAWAAVSQVTAQTVEPLPAGIAGVDPTDPAPVSGVTAPAPPDTRGVGTDLASGPSGRPSRPPGSTTRSYDLGGGNVTVSFAPDMVEVVSVTPSPGYSIKDINRHGALDVEVELRAEDARSRLRAWWDDGPRHRIDEDS